MALPIDGGFPASDFASRRTAHVNKVMGGPPMAAYIPLAERMRRPLPEPQWYVCMTAARREFDADAALRRRGIRTWLPFDRVRVRIKRRGMIMAEPNPQWVKRLHFPRYVFGGLFFEDETIELMETAEHVSKVVRRKFSQEPFRVPNAEMEDLMARTEIDGTADVLDEAGGDEERIIFDIGESVRVRSGHVLAGKFVIIVRDRGGKMVDVDYEATRMRIAIKATDLERVVGEAKKAA